MIAGALPSCFGVVELSLVYKFFPPERKSFLEDFLIRFTPPIELNDPFECLPAFTVADLNDIRTRIILELELRFSPADAPEEIKEIVSEMMRLELEKAVKELGSLEEMRATCHEMAGEKINNGLGVLSLSNRWDSSLMWSHYTSSYTGFCVGFDSKHSYFKGDRTPLGDRSELLSVLYSENRASILPDRFVEGDARRIMLTKSKDWEYEQEARILSVLSLASRRIPKEPYPIDLFEIPKDAIAEVIVGARMDAETLEFIKSAASALDVSLYQTKVSDMTFDIDRTKMIM